MTKKKKEEHKHNWRTVVARQRAWVDWLSCEPFQTKVELQTCECGADRAFLPEVERGMLERKYFNLQ